MNTVVCVGASCYRVLWCKNLRMVKILEKLLCGRPVNHRSGRYYYALFCNGYGFALKRKDAAVPEWEQTWTSVCEVEHIT